MPINWAILMNTAPIIVEGARELIKTINKKKEDKQDNTKLEHPKIQDMDTRLGNLETKFNEMMDYDASQSEIIKKLAEQNSQMLIAIRKMRSYIIGSMVLSSVAIIIAIFYYQFL